MKRTWIFFVALLTCPVLVRAADSDFDGATPKAEGILDQIKRITQKGMAAELKNTGPVYSAAFNPATNAVTYAEEGILGVVYSQDGQYRAKAGKDGRVMLLKATGATVKQVKFPRKTAYSAAFNPSGEAVVIGRSDRKAVIWIPLTGETSTLRGHRGAVRYACYSPDGSRIVTASWDKTAIVWDASTRKKIRTLRHKNWVNFASFSPDGSRIVTGSSEGPTVGVATVWDAASGAALLELRGHSAPVTAAVFNPEGSRVATASADGTAKIWDAATGEVIDTIGHAGAVWAVQYSGDGSRVLTAGDDGARVWKIDLTKEEEEMLSKLEEELVPAKPAQTTLHETDKTKAEDQFKIEL